MHSITRCMQSHADYNAPLVKHSEPSVRTEDEDPHVGAGGQEDGDGTAEICTPLVCGCPRFVPSRLVPVGA